MTTIANWATQAAGFDEQFKKSDYKYLGWQVGTENPDYNTCFLAGHMKMPHTNSNFRIIREMAFSNRGSHHTFWCTVCKIWWNIDMSD